MISRWANQKQKAVTLRREGNSIKDIEKMLGIPRSTLSGWFKSILLTKRQQTKLEQKRNVGTSLGSSDTRIAKFFIRCLLTIYGMPKEKIKCYLHLRADQSPEKMKLYWSHELRLPLANFGKASIDKRTEGKATYPHYKGVCLIECGRVDIQRRLMYIAYGFCERIASGSEATMRA